MVVGVGLGETLEDVVVGEGFEGAGVGDLAGTYVGGRIAVDADVGGMVVTDVEFGFEMVCWGGLVVTEVGGFAVLDVGGGAVVEADVGGRVVTHVRGGRMETGVELGFAVADWGRLVVTDVGGGSEGASVGDVSDVEFGFEVVDLGGLVVTDVGGWVVTDVAFVLVCI